MNPSRTKIVSLLLVGACTRYGEPRPVYGDRQEVARRLVGSPMVEEVTSANVDIGGAGAANGGVAAGFAVGGLSTVKRTHCVQQAQVDYSEQVDYVSHVEHRAGDIVPSSIMLGVGLLAVLGAYSTYQRDVTDHASDPMFYPEPTQPTGTYAIGGALAAAGGAWLTYALVGLPKGPAPTRPSGKRTWTETAYVEAQGCN